MIKERLSQLRRLMEERGMDAYLVPTADFHESEYVGEYFKCRKFLTGFTGSAGTLVVTKDEALLWVDGRYFVQAEEQLKGSTVQMMKMGEEGVPEVEEFIAQAVPPHGCLGFDGRVVNSCTGKQLEKLLAKKDASICYEEDLADLVWTDRPPCSARPVWQLKEEYAGKSAAEKIRELRDEMEKEDATVHILTTLDDIVWLLNIRGDDVPCNPVALSYLAVTGEKLYLFIQPQALDEDIKAYLAGLQAEVRPYDGIYAYVKELKNERVLLEEERVNYAILRSLHASNQILNRLNPTVLAKAVKNPVEIENMKKAHIKDGVAVTKFICWLKNQVGKIPMTERSVSEHLENLRREQEGYIGPSFPTISAYGEHAAMCHYLATPQSDTAILARGMYLVDSGGHYYEGTTDITRTIVLGPVTDKEREHFTLVAMSMLRLSHGKFPYGCRGVSLDYAARQLFWSRGMNYSHGTGHGVGYLLNVHEPPNGIRYEMDPERMDYGVLKEGMVCSNEPGFYVEGGYGIRTENLMVCKKAEKNQYGQFMEFECLTFVPIDLDGLDLSVMEETDIQYLNDYHRQVRERILPYLTEEEATWLKEATREVSKK